MRPADVDDFTADELCDEALALRVDLLPTHVDRAKQLVGLLENLSVPWAPIAAQWSDPSLRPAEPPGTIPMPPARRRKRPK